MEKKDWEDLIGKVREMGEWFPDTLVFIGGIAVWARCMEAENGYGAMTHDADIAIGDMEFSDLRSLEQVMTNRRLGKHEFIKGGFSFDVYEARSSKLPVPVDEIISESEVIHFGDGENSIRVANLGHLLKMKAVAAKDRAHSMKGKKDQEDIIKILMLMENVSIPENIHRLDDDDMNVIDDAVKSDAVVRIASGNLHEAKPLRNQSKQMLQRIKGILSHEGPEP